MATAQASIAFRSRLPKLARGLVAAGLVLALSACATMGSDREQAAKGASKAEAAALKEQEAKVSSLIKEDPIAAAAYWGSLYDSNPANPEPAARYGEALRKVGNLERALRVLEQAAARHPQDPRVLNQYGKTLMSLNRAAEAVPVLGRAATIAPKDASILAAEGVALDQVGDHAAAKERYKAALALEPDNVTTLNNYALSCLLTGELSEAERLLRQATGTPGANALMRQNLALVLALQGKYEEAERLANVDLLPSAASNNIAYVRELLGQPARWNDMSGAGGTGSQSAPAAATIATPAAPAADQAKEALDTKTKEGAAAVKASAGPKARGAPKPIAP